jgi:hypothetical protein
MQRTPLRHFIEEILRLSAGFAGMGGASAGIIGSSSRNDPLINQLRTSTLAFAAEYVKTQPDGAVLSALAEEIEGGLRSLRLINGLSDGELEKLLEELHTLHETPNRETPGR